MVFQILRRLGMNRVQPRVGRDVHPLFIRTLPLIPDNDFFLVTKRDEPFVEQGIQVGNEQQSIEVVDLLLEVDSAQGLIWRKRSTSGSWTRVTAQLPCQSRGSY